MLLISVSFSFGFRYPVAAGYDGKRCENSDETDNAEIAYFLKFLRIKAAIDGDTLPGDIPCLLGRKESHQCCNLLRLPETVHRDGLPEFSLIQAIDHIGPDKTWSHGIDCHTFAANLLCKGLCRPDQTGLCSGVVALPRQSLQTGE